MFCLLKFEVLCVCYCNMHLSPNYSIQKMYVIICSHVERKAYKLHSVIFNTTLFWRRRKKQKQNLFGHSHILWLSECGSPGGKFNGMKSSYGPRSMLKTNIRINMIFLLFSLTVAIYKKKRSFSCWTTYYHNITLRKFYDPMIVKIIRCKLKIGVAR